VEIASSSRQEDLVRKEEESTLAFLEESFERGERPPITEGKDSRLLITALARKKFTLAHKIIEAAAAESKAESSWWNILFASKFYTFINQKDASGMSALSYSAAAGEGALVDRLISLGAVSDEVTFAKALESDSFSCMLLLLKEKRWTTHVFSTDSGPETALYRAAQLGKATSLHALIQAGAQIDSHATKKMNTPLHGAAGQGHAKCVEKLLSAGAAVSAVNKDGWSALHFAAACGHPACVSVLLAHQASVDKLTTNRPMTPLGLAIENRQLGCCELLYKQGGASGDPQTITAIQKTQSAYMLAVEHNFPQVIGLLASNQLQTNMRAESARTPNALHCAVLREYYECIKALLEAGIDPASKNREGNTALHLAAQTRRTQILSILLEYTAHPDVCDAQGDTALMYLCKPRILLSGEKQYADSLEPIALLLARRAKVNVANKRGATPLTQALENRYVPQLRLLMEASSADDLFQYGDHVLHSAARNGNILLVKTVCEAGVNVNITSKRDGKTALHNAVEHGELEVAEALLAHGANPDITDYKGRTPLMLIEGVPHFFRKWGDYRAQRTLPQDHSVECFEMLIRKGAKLSVNTTFGRQCLIEAVRHSAPEVIRCLQGTPETTSASTQNYASPCLVALRDAKICIERLPEKDLQALLHIAVSQNDADLTGHVLDAGVQANCIADGTGALHEAVRNKNSVIVGLLLSYGADPDAQDHRGCTPLDYASRHNAVDEDGLCKEDALHTILHSLLTHSDAPIKPESSFARTPPPRYTRYDFLLSCLTCPSQPATERTWNKIEQANLAEIFFMHSFYVCRVNVGHPQRVHRVVRMLSDLLESCGLQTQEDTLTEFGVANILTQIRNRLAQDTELMNDVVEVILYELGALQFERTHGHSNMCSFCIMSSAYPSAAPFIGTFLRYLPNNAQSASFHTILPELIDQIKRHTTQRLQLRFKEMLKKALDVTEKNHKGITPPWNQIDTAVADQVSYYFDALWSKSKPRSCDKQA
jgi:ankyrin repeat protein